MEISDNNEDNDENEEFIENNEDNDENEEFIEDNDDDEFNEEMRNVFIELEIYEENEDYIREENNNEFIEDEFIEDIERYDEIDINDEIYSEEEYKLMKIMNKKLKDYKKDRKFYEDEKLKYQVNNIYRKYGFKINKKKLEEIISSMIRYNFNIEKNENLYKKDFKEDLIDFKLRNNENIKKIYENLSKNNFRIPKKYKYKKNLAKFIRKMYREYKWLRTNNFKFLITENFKKIEEIEKIKLNRNGLVLCYNGVNKIVCIYFFYLIENYLNDIIESLIPYVYNNYEEIELDGILNEKRYLDNKLKDKRIEEKIF